MPPSRSPIGALPGCSRLVVTVVTTSVTTRSASSSSIGHCGVGFCRPPICYNRPTSCGIGSGTWVSLGAADFLIGGCRVRSQIRYDLKCSAMFYPPGCHTGIRMGAVPIAVPGYFRLLLFVVHRTCAASFPNSSNARLMDTPLMDANSCVCLSE